MSQSFQYITYMGRLADQIRRAVQADRYIFSDHADNMLRERAMTHWQIVDGLTLGKVLSERTGTRPNPTIEVEQLLPDGTPSKAIWAYINAVDLAKVVTIHFFDR